MKLIFFNFCFLLISLVSCNEFGEKEKKKKEVQDWKSILVTATAYNSLSGQGKGNPSITAWGDTLRPGMKSIAVSRDLLEKGLGYMTPVKIEGLEGVFLVRDKMHSRWKNKIDIYMGTNRSRALEWGKRSVKIRFPSKEIDLD